MKREKIVIVGYGGHAKSIIDSIKRADNLDIFGYTDIEDKHMDIQYLGNDDRLQQLYDEGVRNIAFGLGYMGESDIRESLYERVKAIGFQLPVITDPTSTIAIDAEIGEGSFIGKHAVVNAASRIGKLCIINTGAIIEHENVIGDYTHVAVGTVICGNVHIGNRCLLGANSTIIQGVTIQDHSIIGAGSVVLSDVRENETVVGIPARTIKRR